MTASAASKALSALLKSLGERLRPCEAPCPDPALIDPTEPLLAEFVRSFLVWEAGTAPAHAALKRMARRVVDFNELRVCLPDEIASMLGASYPRVQERALRLRAALSELFLREHAVTLQPIAAMGKREAKAYLDSLEGVPHFVAARVSLLSLDVHAAPVDGRIVRRLVEAEIVPAGTAPEAAMGALERAVKAGEMAQAYTLLQLWADELPEALPPDDPEHEDGAEGEGAAKGSRKGSARGAAANGVVKKSASAGSPKPPRTRKSKPKKR